MKILITGGCGFIGSHIGYGKQRSIKGLADMIISESNSLSEVYFKPARIGDIKYSMAEPHKLRSAGWIPKYNFKESLLETIFEAKQKLSHV